MLLASSLDRSYLQLLHHDTLPPPHSDPGFPTFSHYLPVIEFNIVDTGLIATVDPYSLQKAYLYFNCHGICGEVVLHFSTIRRGRSKPRCSKIWIQRFDMHWDIKDILLSTALLQSWPGTMHIRCLFIPSTHPVLPLRSHQLCTKHFHHHRRFLFRQKHL